MSSILRFPLIGVFLLTVLAMAPELLAQSGESADVRVEVQLKNGSTIVGVAQNGRLRETPGRRGYRVTDDASDSRSGIRIWYYREQEGFVFLPYRNIKSVTRIATLTPKETADIRRAAVKAEKKRKKRARDLADARKRRSRSGSDSKSRSSKSKSSAKSSSGAEGGPELTRRQKDLLEEFPPGEWTRARYGKIQRTRAILGRQPVGAEKRFCDVFAEWDVARRLQESAGESSAKSPADND